MTDANRRWCVLALAAVLLAGCESRSETNCERAGGLWIYDEWRGGEQVQDGCYSITRLHIRISAEPAPEVQP